MKGKPFIICGIPNNKVTGYEMHFVELEENYEYTLRYDNGNWICISTVREDKKTQITEAIEEIKKCRGNAEAKRIAVACMEYLINLQGHMESDLLSAVSKGAKNE